MCFFLYSHQARSSNDEGAPARNIKPVNNVWSSYFHAADEKSVRASGPHGEPKKRKKGGEKKRSPKAGWRESGEEIHVFPVPFPSRLHSGW